MTESMPLSVAPESGSDVGRLVVTGLEKSYRGRTVVQDAGLMVSAGEAVGLLGPNLSLIHI